MRSQIIEGQFRSVITFGGISQNGNPGVMLTGGVELTLTLPGHSEPITVLLKDSLPREEGDFTTTHWCPVHLETEGASAAEMVAAAKSAAAKKKAARKSKPKAKGTAGVG